MWWFRRRPWRRRPQRRWRWRRWRRRPTRRVRRRAARPPRRRRVRRLRRRRGWVRRSIIRRRRRWRRRRKKINIQQWNPPTVRKCVVTGYLPLLICGTGTTGTTYRNYGSHTTDYKKYDPFGGGVSTMQFTFQNLYEEYEKHHNRWSRSNVDLELIRYKGCKFTLYRHPEVDFIFGYNRKWPFTDSLLTCPALQPGIQLATMKKRKIILPSYKTKPKGPIKKTIRIKPPTMFTDRWYFQNDFRSVPLVTTEAVAASLRFPMCSPQTDNICIYFQVLGNWYNTACSISPSHLDNNYTAFKNHLNNTYNAAAGTTQPKSGPTGTVFNTFKTQEHVVDPKWETYKQQNPPSASTNKYYQVSSLWGDHVYTENIVNAFFQNADKMWNARQNKTFSEAKSLNHKTGFYSSIFLSRERLSPDFPGIYKEVVYNPQNDKGIGNKVWIDWCTKNDTQFRDVPGRLTIADVPLYAALLGYEDYCIKYYHDKGLAKEVRVTIQCPYTEPPLFDKDNTDMGFLPYDYNFGNGKMPDGNGYIPMEYRFKWYLCMFHQKNWMNDIVQCGPFAYQGDQRSCVLMCKYKFNFLFGGNPIPQQTLKDPASQPTFPVPGAGPLLSRLQITNPRLQEEGYLLRKWDIRRGFFGHKAIKRMYQQQKFAESVTGPPKRSKFEVPADTLAEGSSSLERKHLTWSDESQAPTETETEAQEEEEEKSIHLHLRKQYREQQQLRCQLEHLILEVAKTQQHLHAPIFQC
nr:MAG: ORF1 [Torque teno virus]